MKPPTLRITHVQTKPDGTVFLRLSRHKAVAIHRDGPVSSAVRCAPPKPDPDLHTASVDQLTKGIQEYV